MNIQVPSIGRIVHYVLADFDGVQPRAVGEHRPAVIVRVWPGEYGNAECQDGINARVLLDGGNDTDHSPDLWKTSVEYSAESKPGTWHWPERT